MKNLWAPFAFHKRRDSCGIKFVQLASFSRYSKVEWRGMSALSLSLSLPPSSLCRLSAVMSWRPRFVTRNYSWNRHRSLYSIQRAWISPDYRIRVAHAKYQFGRCKWNSRNPLKGSVRTLSDIPGSTLIPDPSTRDLERESLRLLVGRRLKSRINYYCLNTHTFIQIGIFRYISIVQKYH